MKKYAFLLLSLLIAGTSFAQDKKKNYDEAFTLATVWLEAQKDFEQLPGLTIAVIDDQEVRWQKAFGEANKTTGKATEVSTLFSICSISKLFTAVAVMNLYEEGKLRLDDEVQDLLPWYNLQQQYPESGPVTVRSLLTHSSGLPRESAQPYWTGPDFPFPTDAEIKQELGTQKTLYPASTYFQYSNLGLTLLGEIVEEVSGKDYDSYVQEHILTPLGLHNTRTSLPQDLHGQELAMGYSAMLRKGEREEVRFFQANGIKAAAGFSSNVIDLGKFASWQLRLLDSKEEEILKPSTLKNMHRVHWTNPDWTTNWGLGFSVYERNGKSIVGHGGSCPGYRSSLSIDPSSKMAYTAMINAGGTSPNKYINGLRSILSKVETMDEETEEISSKAQFKDYIGLYNPQPWGSEVYYGSWNGKLVSLGLPTSSPGNAMTFYEHVEGDTFRRVRDNGELGEEVNFVRDRSGKVISAEQHGNYVRKM